ncbi:hypothetical protein ACO0K1_20145 [Undibacterium sp. SXout20W]
MRFLIPLIFVSVSSVAFAGYDDHVTRKVHWADANGPLILLTEWRRYVQGDRDVQPDNQNTENDFIVTVDGESFPLWYEPKFGELRTTDPSEKAVEKLKKIAVKLKAKVQGDDGELYDKK